ncbi:MAG: SDR family NAD(P)-dependent oxidoreductase [Parasphingorhabdus sp.]|nr:SDR family NAD(P)-dependent oxidoreductase [Parasphingorhabdus sp.]
MAQLEKYPSIAELFDLGGQTAIVTGAGQGMGRGVALALANAGAKLVIAGRTLSKCEAVAAEIIERGGEAVAVACDVTSLEDLDTTVAKAMESFGRIDILVNNAGGIHPFTPFIDVTPETWTGTIDRNMKGTYFLTQNCVREMIAAGRGGRIVNIASTAAFKPDALLAAYNSAKAATVVLTRSLAVELAPYGILVNTVAPGPIHTDNTAKIYANPKIAAMVKERVPVGGPGEPEDVGNAVLFCASPAARHMTGGLIVIDGGYMWT